MKHHWRDSTLRQVTQLLQSALAPLVDARVTALASPIAQQEPGWPLVRLKDEAGRTSTLAVVPWSEGAMSPHDHQVLWVLQRSTKRIQEQLRQRDESFVDTSGAVRLHLPGILIDRSDLRKPALQDTQEVRNPYSDKNSLVVRSLLTELRSWIPMQELAQRATLSLASTSYVVKALRRSGSVTTKRTSRGLLIKLTDYEGLIREWTRQYDWTKNPALTFAAPVGSPPRFLQRLTKLLQNYRWALTLQAGAALVAPHAIWDHVHLYVDADSERALAALGKDLGWEISPTGKVTMMLPYYRNSVWHNLQTVKGQTIVSNIQLILDLWYYPVRGREQAEHLLTMASAKDHDSVFT